MKYFYFLLFLEEAFCRVKLWSGPQSWNKFTNFCHKTVIKAPVGVWVCCLLCVIGCYIKPRGYDVSQCGGAVYMEEPSLDKYFRRAMKFRQDWHIKEIPRPKMLTKYVMLTKNPTYLPTVKLNRGPTFLKYCSAWINLSYFKLILDYLKLKLLCLNIMKLHEILVCILITSWLRHSTIFLTIFFGDSISYNK